jgi:hypothetical protein
MHTVFQMASGSEAAACTPRATAADMNDKYEVFMLELTISEMI